MNTEFSGLVAAATILAALVVAPYWAFRRSRILRTLLQHHPVCAEGDGVEWVGSGDSCLEMTGCLGFCTDRLRCAHTANGMCFKIVGAWPLWPWEFITPICVSWDCITCAKPEQGWIAISILGGSHDETITIRVQIITNVQRELFRRCAESCRVRSDSVE